MHRHVRIHLGDVGQESQHEFGSEHVYEHVCVVHIGVHNTHIGVLLSVYMTIYTVYIRKTILDTLKMLSLDSTSH